MKVAAYILATVVILLSIKPGIDAIASTTVTSSCYSTSTCHSSFSTSHDDDTQDTHDGDMCNPFQSCCPCLLELTSLHILNVERGIITTKNLFSYDAFFASAFIADFWQPPQFA